MFIEQIPQTSIAGFKLKRVAAYARVSSDKDTAEHSLEAQISYYQEYISGYPGWVFAGIYADNGISGTKDDRPEFQRMVDDCRAGKIDMIITKSVTRFARNIVTLLSTIRELKLLNIDVLFEKENLHSISAEGELLLSLLAMYAEEESRSASENKRWQIQKFFEAGRPTYFRIYGYRWVDEQLIVVPEEAEVIRRIFDMYLSGMGREAIARKLNEEGLALRGSRWKSATIHRILRNEKYAGNLLLQKSYRPDFRTKKDVRNHGERRQYFVENYHEPIIDRETFDKAQAEIASRQRQTDWNGHIEEESLFRGMITCRQCGAKYYYKNQRIKSSVTNVPTWKCATFLELGRDYCNAKQIRESILIDKTKQVLEMSEDEELTREIILDKIDSIESAADNKLRFFLKNRRVEIVSWENPSRSKSWTPEMKERARQKSLERVKRRKEIDHA